MNLEELYNTLQNYNINNMFVMKEHIKIDDYLISINKGKFRIQQKDSNEYLEYSKLNKLINITRTVINIANIDRCINEFMKKNKTIRK